jgi:hypothetical protein
MVPGLNNSRANIIDSAQSSRPEQLVEVSVFLFLILPSMFLSFFAVKQGSLSFVLVALATILRDLALVSLILFFFMWRNGEPLIGLAGRSKPSEKKSACASGFTFRSSLLPDCWKAPCGRSDSPPH